MDSAVAVEGGLLVSWNDREDGGARSTSEFSRTGVCSLLWGFVISNGTRCMMGTLLSG